MSLSIGIIGLPNAGKSTLFNALLGKQQAQVAAYPFTTIEPNTGVIEVPDERLDQLAALVQPGEVRPAKITFVDIAGLVEGAHQGEGLGNQFLAHIRETDAIINVVDAFSKTADIAADLETVHLELILKDFETVSRKQKQLVKKARGRKKTAQEVALETGVEKLAIGLGEGKLARNLALTREEKEAIKELFLLTMKPEVTVINVSEEALIEDQSLDLTEVPKDTEIVVMSAKTEVDLGELTPEEQAEYRREMNLPSGKLAELIGAGYRALDLITFYTIKGGQIVQAWPVERKTTFIEAADQIHGEVAEKFIVAEAIPADQLLKLGSWTVAKQAGKVRTFSRNDLVEEDLVVEIKT